jgi:hypothetical protein
MSIQAPQGILNIPNATLRVGKLAVDSTAGFDTVFNNVERNTILLVDSVEYTENKQWDLKMPNIFVATFEIRGAGSSFNFRNTSIGDAGVGYTLTFSDTTLTLKYSDSDPVLATATIPELDITYGKVYLTYEKQYFTVTVDGTRVLSYKDTGTRTFPDGEYINFFAGGDGGFKNLKVVAGHLISDGTSNVSLYGGLAVTSNLEVGSSNLFVDTVNSRVGMGTTTPEATLHVSGNAYVSSNLEVGSSNLFVDTVSGRVGVGTDTPKESLDVVGNMHLTRVSNVSQIKVDANVVTEYTGPHDRPLRKYPEVALTANDNSSTSGYVADQSSTNGFADGLAYRLFDHSTTAYQSGGAFSGGIATGSNPITTASDESTHQGVAITLDLATKIRLSYAKITSHTFYGRTPAYGSFLGSNDNTTWELIGTFAGLSTTAVGQTHTVHIADYASKSAYRYIRLVVTRTSDSLNLLHGGTLLEFRELEYYGHEEGSGSLDTTLKSVYNVPATTGTQLEVYYDGQDYTQASDFTGTGGVVDKAGGDQDGTAGTGVTFDSTYKAFVFDGTTNGKITTSIINDIGDWVHSASVWVKVETGQVAATSAYISLLGTTDSAGTRIAFDYKEDESAIRLGINAAFVQWNNVIVPNQWHHITYTYKGGSISGENYNLYVDGKYVEYSTLQGTSTLTLAQNTTLSLGQSHLATNYFTGSIANFRLYSKALNAGQVQELYDYQKDYFLGSKSQVTLYKGHLGVGVTEPSGQLELAGDERIQEYPPRGMTGYETLVEGHGVFKVYSTGGLYNNGSGGNLPWTVFNKITGTFNDGTSWVSEDAAAAGAGGNYNNDGSSGYGGSHRLSSNTPLGDYLVICLPYSIVLKSYSLSNLSGGTGYGAADFPRDYIIYGSNDDVNWEVVDSRSDQEAGGLAPAAHVSAGYLGYTNNYTVSENNKVYSKFAIVITDLNAKQWYDYTSGTYNASYAGISEWRLFGTPGPTTLDKGSLSLTRSLDVPRVSRYDVDTETPRPEKLVVDFDTTVNSSPTDISGQGNHGTFYNGASYSAADKAFVFDGTDDYIQASGVTLPTAHSMSVWFNMDSDQSGIDSIMHIGTFNTADESRIFTNGNLLHATIYGSTIQYATSLSPGSWYHVVYTFTDGTTFNTTNAKVYVNGQLVPTTQTQTAATLNLVGNTVTIGATSSGTEAFKGKISNPKLYSVILEPSEVKKLYNLGRTGRSMVISDTAVGIGKAPEAQLDVRGVARFDRVDLHGAGRDLTFKYDTGITRQSAANRDAYYSGLENSIKRVGDRNVFDGSLFTPDTTHEILFGFSDNYNQWSGLDQYYPQNNVMRFKLWSSTSSTSGTLSDIMTLRGNGNVGIGVSNPTKMIHTKGEVVVGTDADNYTTQKGSLYFVRGVGRTNDGFGDRHHYISTRTEGNKGNGNNMTFHIDDGTTTNGTSHTSPLKLMGDGSVQLVGWKTKSWSGGTSNNGDRDVDVVTHSGLDSGVGVIAGIIEVIISRGGYGQQRAYARFHVNYSYWSSAFRGSFDVLEKNLQTGVTDITLIISNNPAKIQVRITSPNTSTGQYYIKFDGPIYNPA